MAARRLDLVTTPGPRELPPSPESSPSVIAALRLVGLAGRARDAAARALAEAESAAAAGDDVVAERMLQALAKGEDGPVDEVHAKAEVDAARRRLAAAEGALDLAGARYRESLAEARSQFRTAMLPVLKQALDATRGVIAAAVAANDRLREVAAFGREHDETLPDAWALAYPLPDAGRLAILDSGRAELLTPRTVEPPAGVVALRMLIDTSTHRAGDRIGLPEPDAILWVRSGVATPVDEAVARRLKLDNLVAFDRPQRVKITRDYVPSSGVWTPSGTEVVLDPVSAARVINLDYGVTLGPAEDV